MDQDKFIHELTVAKAEILALQAICASLLAEVAALSGPDPQEKMGTIVVGLNGLSVGLAQAAAADGGVDDSIPKTVTQVIARVTAMAEAVLPPSGK